MGHPHPLAGLQTHHLLAVYYLSPNSRILPPPAIIAPLTITSPPVAAIAVGAIKTVFTAQVTFIAEPDRPADAMTDMQ